MHCITLESEYGVPTVPVVVHVFEDLVRSAARAKGMPHERFVFVPMPVMGRSPSQLRGYIEGDDPVTGKPVMRGIVEALTRPLTAEERREDDIVRTSPRVLEPDTGENLQRIFRENSWTDMLPIVLPTEEKVAEMLKGTTHRPDEVVGAMAPTGTREAWTYTVEKVAVNAVMAGATPEYFPVILALAASRITARQSSTSSKAQMVVVNGPIRKEIGMNAGIGAMGPYNHANASIGRAYGLLSQNLQGGSTPGQTYAGSQGNNYNYNSIIFAENEERSPWTALHVEKGFGPQESVVSIFDNCWDTTFLLGLREKHWREHVLGMLRGMNPRSGVTFVLDPLSARQFVERGGFDTKEKLRTWVHDNTLERAGIYWDYQLVQNYTLPDAVRGVGPYAQWVDVPEDTMIPRFSLSDINVVVVGGETNAYWRIFGAKYAKSMSIDEWR